MLDTSSPSLARGLGLTAATSVVVGEVIGTGVFLKTRVMTCNVGSPGLVLAAWAAAGLLSLCGALTYAELAAMMPRAAGEYVFMREAYGRRWAFLYGWTQSAVAYTGGQAAKAVAFVIFLNILVGGALGANDFTLHLAGYDVPLGGLQIAALATIAVITLVNCLAVTVTGRLAVVLTTVKIALIVAIGLGALVFADGSWSHLAALDAGGSCEGVSATARSGLAGFGAAMLGALWAYDGWNTMAVIAGEIRNPQRNIPLGLIGGVGLVMLLYLFVNAAYFYVLTPTEVASTSAASSVATEAVRRFLGPIAVSLVAASMMTSTLGTLHSGTLAGARFPYAMARDGVFFGRLARVSPRSRVPVNGVLWIGGWAAVLALAGSFDALTDYVIFAEFLFYAMVAASVFIFRRRMPHAERPYRTWGYPVVPIVFVVVSAWLLINTVVATPRQSLTGLALIAIGLPGYWYWSRQSRPPVAAGTKMS